MRFLLPLVVVALLACHGAFGAVHIMPHEFGAEISGGEHFAHQAGMPTIPGEDGLPAGHAGAAAEYAAVLSLVVLGTILWFLMRFDRAWSSASTPPACDLPNVLLGSLGAIPIRGPDAPRLQVFRL